MKLPTFLEHITLTPEEQVTFAGATSNWLKVNGMFQEWTEEDVLKALLVELEGRNRHDLVSRLRKRFEIMRSKRENTEMQSLKCESA